jgi:hypothetical protein
LAHPIFLLYPQYRPEIRSSEIDVANTKVNVAYERTALNPDANEHVRNAGDSDRNGGKEWGMAINDYLAQLGAPRR